MYLSLTKVIVFTQLTLMYSDVEHLGKTRRKLRAATRSKPSDDFWPLLFFNFKVFFLGPKNSSDNIHPENMPMSLT